MKRVLSFKDFLNEDGPLNQDLLRRGIGSTLQKILSGDKSFIDKIKANLSSIQDINWDSDDLQSQLDLLSQATGTKIHHSGSKIPSGTSSTVQDDYGDLSAFDYRKNKPTSNKPIKVSPTDAPAIPTFTYVDLNTSDGFLAYSSIVQNFIDSRKPNLLNITGEMLAQSAKEAFNDTLVVKVKGKDSKVGAKGRYVPPELACAQLAEEGGIGNSDRTSRPIKYANPFNIGNTNTGENRTYDQKVTKGIDAYYFFVARDYLRPPKTANDLLKKYTNHYGARYATAGDYERDLTKLSKEAYRYSAPVLASLGLENKNPGELTA